MARARRLGPCDRLHGEPGQPGDGWADSAARRRRVGARLLPQVPEQAPGLPRRLVQHDQLGHRRGALLECLTPPLARVSRSMGARQKYRLRARSDREVILEVEPGKVYVDRDTGEEFEVVGKLLPLAPSPSELPWAVEHLRMCGCSLEQLAPKDVNDCPHCGRRLPAIER